MAYAPPHPHGPPYPPPPFRRIVPPASPPPLFGLSPPLPFPYAAPTPPSFLPPGPPPHRPVAHYAAPSREPSSLILRPDHATKGEGKTTNTPPIHSRHHTKMHGTPITTRKRTNSQSTRDDTATESPHKRQKVSHSSSPIFTKPIKSTRATQSNNTSKTQTDAEQMKTLTLTLKAPGGEKSHEAAQRREEQQKKEKGRMEEDTDSGNDTFETGLTEEQIQKALATLDYDSLPPYTLKEFAPQWTISEKLAGPKLFAEWQRLSGETKYTAALGGDSI